MNENRSLHDAAVAAWYEDDYETLEKLAADLIQDAQSRGDKQQLGAGYAFAGHARLHREDAQGTQECYEKALAIFTELGDEPGAARVMMSLGAVALELHLDVVEARRLYDIAIPIVRKSGNRQRLAIGLANLGEIFRQEGDYRQAMISAQESLEIFRELDNSSYVGWQLFNMAHYHSLRREYAAAIEKLRTAFVELRKEKNARWLAMYFDVWIIVAIEMKADDCAARLHGFNEHLRDVKKTPRFRGMLPWFLPLIERLTKRMSQDRFFELRAEGAALTLDQAQALTDAVNG